MRTLHEVSDYCPYSHIGNAVTEEVPQGILWGNLSHEQFLSFCTCSYCQLPFESAQTKIDPRFGKKGRYTCSKDIICTSPRVAFILSNSMNRLPIDLGRKQCSARSQICERTADRTKIYDRKPHRRPHICHRIPPQRKLLPVWSPHSLHFLRSVQIKYCREFLLTPD